jgi:hypothetical protein
MTLGLRCLLVVALGMIGMLGGRPALAQDQPADAAGTEADRPGSGKEKSAGKEPSSDPLEPFLKGDYARAEELLKAQAEKQPENFVPLYNLACCRSMSKDAKGAVEYLAKAIEKGFCDAHQLRRDPTLAPVRSDPAFKAILANWAELLSARRDANLKQAELLFKDKAYTNFRDERLRLDYRCAYNERAFGEARAELQRVAAFADRELFTGIFAPEQVKDDAWVVVVLPNRTDFLRWVVSVYGPEMLGDRNSTIGGAYEHDAKRLVSMDIGSTLRHEFFHVLHWRDNTRKGQSHPIWIQEGLASLVEDCEVEGESLRPAPSWRTNIVKRLEKLRKLMPIETLAAMPPTKFSGIRPLANYAQARAVFMYVHSQGQLKAWYTHYTTNHAADPTGIASLEAVLGKPIKEINLDYRAWVRELASVSESIPQGGASLGLEVGPGGGEGPMVTSVDTKARNMLDSKTMLVRGDVIIAIDGKATRDVAELVRVLGTCKVGDTVEVEYRRVRKFNTTRIVLVARP